MRQMALYLISGRSEEKMNRKENKVFICILLLMAGGLLYLLKPILTPFFAGALLAYLADPLVNYLMSYKLSRKTSSIIVFLLLLMIFSLFILLMIPLIQSQIDSLTDVVPNTISWVQNTIVPWAQQNLGFKEQPVNVETVKKALADNLAKAGGAAGWLIQTVFQSGVKFLEFVVNLILVPVVMFYLLCDWDKFIKGIKSLIPRDSVPTVVRLTKECDSVLSAFLRGQFLVMLALGVIYSAGLMAIGLQVGLLIGVMSGLLSIVPYLGFIVGIIAASIAAFIQFGTFIAVGKVCLIYGVGHLIDPMYLTPKLVGGRIGLHPVAVIFAILAGGCLFGFMGVLLALPVASVVMVWVRYLHQRYKHSQLYQQT
jgi:predicted PurR-regulated permease PerM